MRDMHSTTRSVCSSIKLSGSVPPHTIAVAMRLMKAKAMKAMKAMKKQTKGL